MNVLSFWVRFDNDDKEWVATCDQQPYMSYLHKKPHKALKGLIRTMKDDGLL